MEGKGKSRGAKMGGEGWIGEEKEEAEGKEVRAKGLMTKAAVTIPVITVLECHRQNTDLLSHNHALCSIVP